ncbi:hypothetical protein CP532_1864 [Ophiocordyceps camponoti-leonardi (nom. inval.)]|nr:hypothetical protein CP532_1864 [Ophiocordyceps camponoti-leonardi (nom. inval.)]
MSWLTKFKSVIRERKNHEKTTPSSPPRHHPHDEESQTGDDDNDAAIVVHRRLEPSRKLTAHQFFYMFVLDGLGGLVLSGGINFGIAYAMYSRADTGKDPVRLFQLANTLAGDGVVTIFVQCLVTWLIETTLVAYDVRHGSVQTIGWIAEPRNRLLRSFFMLPKDPQLGTPPMRFWGVMPLIQLVIRGLLFAVASFIPFWPISVGILAGVGHRHADGDYYFEKVWAPQVYKLLLGGILGLVTGPLMAMYWLARYGWESQTAFRRAREAAATYAVEEEVTRAREGAVLDPSSSTTSSSSAPGRKKTSRGVDDGKNELALAADGAQDAEQTERKVEESAETAESDAASSSQGESANRVDVGDGEEDKKKLDKISSKASQSRSDVEAVTQREGGGTTAQASGQPSKPKEKNATDVHHQNHEPSETGERVGSNDCVAET